MKLLLCRSLRSKHVNFCAGGWSARYVTGLLNGSKKLAACAQVEARRGIITPSNARGRFEKENIVTVPNLLSLGRIVLSPVLGYLVVTSNYSAALGLFAVAGLSDMLDGYIARSYKGQSSSLGSVLDPLADKCLISVLCVTLTMAELFPLSLTVVIFVRDGMLILSTFYFRYITLPPPFTWRRYWDVERSTVRVSPSLLGKVNTFLQLVLMAASLSSPLLGVVGHPLLLGLGYTTGLTTVGSGLHYLYQLRRFKVLHNNNNNKQ